MPNRGSVTERSHLELSTIYEICRILGSSLDVGRTFRAALNVLAAHLSLPRVMIAMGGEDEVGLRIHSSVGLDQEQESRGHWRHGEGVVGRVFASVAGSMVWRCWSVTGGLSSFPRPLIQRVAGSWVHWRPGPVEHRPAAASRSRYGPRLRCVRTTIPPEFGTVSAPAQNVNDPTPVGAGSVNGQSRT